VNVLITATSQADPTKTVGAIASLAPDPTVISMVGPVNPNSGAGASQLFRFNATPISGNLVWIYMLFNTLLSPAEGCEVYFDPTVNTMYLLNDDATNWVGSAVPGTPGAILANSRCSIDAGNSSVQTSGASMSVGLSVTFSAAWSGAQPYIFMAAADSSGNQVDWPILGSWSIP
jgi:hypothetical protein